LAPHDAKTVVWCDATPPGLSGVPRAVFEVCSAATLVGSQFFTHHWCEPERQHSQHVDACLTSGKTAAWTAAPLGARCARTRPPHSTGGPNRQSPGLALLSAPMPSGRSRLRYASRKRPFSGPGKLHIVLCRTIVKRHLSPSLRGAAEAIQPAVRRDSGLLPLAALGVAMTGLVSLSPCGRGCLSHKRVHARLRRAMAKAGEGSALNVWRPTPHPARISPMLMLATLSRKGRGKKGTAFAGTTGVASPGPNCHVRTPRMAAFIRGGISITGISGPAFA
jgi:hypothetical protein